MSRTPAPFSDANPLGALYACHEERGLFATHSGEALEVVKSASLVRGFLVADDLTSDSPTACEFRYLVGSLGATVVTAHYHRQWCCREPALPPQQLALFVLAKHHHHSALELLSALEEAPLSDGVVDVAFAAVSSRPDDRLRLRLASAVRSGDCAGLRFLSDPSEPPTEGDFGDRDELSLCDSPDLLLRVLCADVARWADSPYGRPTGRLSYLNVVGLYADLLRASGERHQDARLLVAAQVCQAPVSAERMLALLDAVAAGRVTDPV